MFQLNSIEQTSAKQGTLWFENAYQSWTALTGEDGKDNKISDVISLLSSLEQGRKMQNSEEDQFPKLREVVFSSNDVN